MPATYRADKDLHRRLRHAAWKGDVEMARQMLRRGAKLEATDGDNYTPLLIASRWNRMDMVKVCPPSPLHMRARSKTKLSLACAAAVLAHGTLGQHDREKQPGR